MNLKLRMTERTSASATQVADAAQGYSLAERVQGWLRMKTPREQHMRLVETLALGPKRSVALIQVDGQSFLAGMGTDGVTTLVPVNATEKQHVLAGAA